MRVLVATLFSSLGLAGVAGGWAGWLELTGNVHEIEPGVYRSGQLGPERMAEFVRNHGIRTVINLRGENAGSRWYREELTAVTTAGANHVSVRLSANRAPDPATMASLTTALETSRTPMLIHCSGGADRSGLAAALYELLVLHRSKEDASGQLSFRYGHLPWLFRRTSAMDTTFAEYARSGPRR